MALGAAAPGLAEEEPADPPVAVPPVALAVLVLLPPVSVTPFETVMSLLDGFACVGAVLLGKAEERNPEVVVPGVEEAPAGVELGLAPAGVEL